MSDDICNERPDRSDDLAFLFLETEKEYYSIDRSICRDALDYQPTRARHLELMAAHLGLRSDDVFVDLGCGKGRVVCFVAMQGVAKAVGVEIRHELAEFARAKVRELRPAAPVEIIAQDAAAFYSADATVFYLFNPFGEETLARVLNNIRRSLDARPRTVRIVYNNSVCATRLDNACWLARDGEIPGTDMLVWRSTT